MHSLTPHQRSALRLGSLCVAGAMLSFSALAATPTASAQAAEIQARFEQDRVGCLGVKPSPERAHCLREATRARDSARNAPIYDDATYRQNRLDRCRVLSGDEARDCLARMRGEGLISGSVEGGGIFRETVTYEVKPVPAPSMAPAATAP